MGTQGHAADGIGFPRRTGKLTLADRLERVISAVPVPRTYLNQRGRDYASYARRSLPAHERGSTPLLKPRRFKRATALMVLTVLPALLCGSTPAATAAPTTVDLEQLVGPQTLSTANPPLTVGAATFTGGQLLTNTFSLPADETTLYGTSPGCDGCRPQLRINFSEPVTAPKLPRTQRRRGGVVVHGYDRRRYFRNSHADCKLRRRAQIFVVPGSAIASVTISRTQGIPDTFWDFFIDDVRFSPALPKTKEQCKNGGWRTYGDAFKNQGDCVGFVATGGRNAPTGTPPGPPLGA